MGEGAEVTSCGESSRIPAALVPDASANPGSSGAEVILSEFSSRDSCTPPPAPGRAMGEAAAFSQGQFLERPGIVSSHPFFPALGDRGLSTVLRESSGQDTTASATGHEFTLVPPRAAVRLQRSFFTCLCLCSLFHRSQENNTLFP